MPSAYTAGVQDGTITSLDQFAMQCARAFGALVMMRDEPFSAPIPARFEPKTDYSSGRLTEARARLSELDAMTDDQAAAAALAEFEKAIADRAERRTKRNQDRARYETLLVEVERWRPPSKGHAELKEFMRDQLRESISFDCGTEESFDRYYPVPELLSGPDWLATERAKAQNDISYHEQQIREEVERTEGRNEWLRALRNSLTPEAAS